MLLLELEKIKFNKASHNRNILPLLDARTKAAIEKKHQNISAVLRNMGLPFIIGYKPLNNYQKVLEEEVSIFLRNNRPRLEKQFDKFADMAIAAPNRIDFENVLDSQPKHSGLVKEKEPNFRPIKINYLEKEQNNRTLGEEGEKFVLEYEKWRLITAGKPNLADKIEWVSKEKGDGMGYDILSRNINGTDRFVEVKTTKLSKETPIYLTRNEVAFAMTSAKNFYLYRVFNFGSNAQLFIKNGSYKGYCILQPMTFKGIF